MNKIKCLMTISSLLALSSLSSADRLPLQGAVAFRFDDNKSPEEYRRLYDVFSKYHAPCSLVVNPVRLSENNETVELLKTFVQKGCELVDHSPSHSCMKIEFSSEADALRVKDDPGVDHIDGKTVFLKCRVNDKYKHNKKFTAEIKGNHLENMPEGMKKELRDQDFLVFPDGAVYGVHLKDGIYTLCSPADQCVSVQDSEKLELIRTDRWGLQMTEDAYRLLAKTSKEFFEKAGLPRPKSFVTPGGWGVFPSDAALAGIYGKEFGYTAGDAFNCWSGTYNRPDPERARFSLSPNWDSLERLDVPASKKQIADLLAKHRVSIFISHLWVNNLPGGLDELLRRHDELLAWLRAKNILVLTMAQCAERLYGQAADPEFNLMPPLTIDLDEDGVPDGFELLAGTILKDGVLSREQPGDVFVIRKLSGINAGTNRFSCVVNAPAGTSVIIKIGIYEDRNSNNVASWLPDMRFTTISQNESLTQSFSVPDSCPGIDVRCTVSAQGPLTLGNFSIRKE